MIASPLFKSFLFNSKTCGVFCFHVASFVVTAKKTTEYLQDKFKSIYEAQARAQPNFSFRQILSNGSYYYYGPTYYGELAIEKYANQGKEGGLALGILGNLILGYIYVFIGVLKIEKLLDSQQFDFRANLGGVAAAGIAAVGCRLARISAIPAVVGISLVGALISGGIAAYRSQR